MKVFLTVLAGSSATDAQPVFATDNSHLVEVVMDRLNGLLGLPVPVSDVLRDESFQDALSPDAANAVREGVSISEEPELKPAA